MIFCRVTIVTVDSRRIAQIETVGKGRFAAKEWEAWMAYLAIYPATVSIGILLALGLAGWGMI